MLSVIGLLRFAMGIPENIVEKNEIYEVEELSIDPRRTIQKSLLAKEIVDDTGTVLRLPKYNEVIKNITVEREDDLLRLN
jgi:ribosomal protein L19